MSENKTRDRIIQAMYRLSAERGFDKSSIGLICQEVGITKPSVYFYFKNKEEIYLETVRSFFHESDEYDLPLSPENEDDYYDSLLKFGNTIIDNFKSDTERRRFMSEIDIQSTRLESVRSFLEEHRHKKQASLRACVEKGFEIGFFGNSRKPDEIAELMDIVLVEIGDRILLIPGYKGKAVWKLLIDSLRG